MLLFIVCFLAITLLFAGVFILTHLRPLCVGEIERLATKRRLRQAAAYFHFSLAQRTVNPQFKSRMKPTGRFYTVAEPLCDWPSLAAALTKYKKHEWILIAFERDREVHQLWLNKGPNNTTVSSLAPIAAIIVQAKELQCISVLISHHHPNSNPACYDCTRPSDTDRQTSALWGPQFASAGLNLIEFVCERGRHYEYHRTYAESFMPRSVFVKGIEDANGQSRLRNLALHWERIVV